MSTTTHRRERRRIVGSDFGYRPLCAWGDGDLPAPWAVGDLARYPPCVSVAQWRDLHYNRLRPGDPGPDDLAVIDQVDSVDDGDAWFVRLVDLAGRTASLRLRQAWAERSTWNVSVDHLAGVELVDTADPDGLALRQQMLADGWTLTAPETCPTCGRAS